MAITAYLDVWTDDLIAGWAADDAGEKPVQLEILIAGRRLGSIRADQYRGDLGANVAFNLSVAHLPRGLSQHLQLRVVGSDQTWSGPASTDPESSTNDDLRGMHSLFGGMWIDRSDWQDTLSKKVLKGGVDLETAELIKLFVRDGYVVLPGALSQSVVDRVNEDVERGWRQEIPGLLIETFMIDPGSGQAQVVPIDPQYRYGSTKLLDAYTRMASAQEASAAPSVVRFLSAIFEDSPRAFQQLHFTMGSQQRIHKDTAYVKVDRNAMALAATWLALEDISPGTGELEYYVGSHRAPDYLFGEVSKWMEHAPQQHEDFLDSLDRDAATIGHPKASFLGKSGDVLIWHADLAHGGSPITKPGITRKSLVTHYTARKFTPFYMRNHKYSQLAAHGVEFTSNYSDICTY